MRSSTLDRTLCALAALRETSALAQEQDPERQNPFAPPAARLESPRRACFAEGELIVVPNGARLPRVCLLTGRGEEEAQLAPQSFVVHHNPPFRMPRMIQIRAYVDEAEWADRQQRGRQQLWLVLLIWGLAIAIALVLSMKFGGEIGILGALAPILAASLLDRRRRSRLSPLRFVRRLDGYEYLSGAHPGLLAKLDPFSGTGA